jgi:hypothetical protein
MDDQMILDQIRTLGERKEMPDDKLFKVSRKVEVLLNDPDFKKMRERTPITAVMVYRTGEGGVVLKVTKGDGLVYFQQGGVSQEVSLDSWQIGAHVGGAMVWGAALALGLRDPAHFGGDYVGEGSSATLADTSTGEHLLLRLSNPPSETQAHNLVFIQAALGLSADAGGYKVSITPK